MKEIIKKIHELSGQIGRDVNLMEVCGTHTQAISRYGIREVMPKNVHLITGPGCPVCVTAQSDIDSIVSLALAGVPVATYGDLLRVPGNFGSLNQAREAGAKVFDVYSTEDALELKEEYPDLVFFGLGFETTAPMTAYAIRKGLTVYSTHKLFLPAMHAILKMGEIKIDGFIDPGHVAAVIGVDPFKKIKAPQVISGFEADDVLSSIYFLLKQIKNGDSNVENTYQRVVKDTGNAVATEAISDVFKVADGEWRGFGVIADSGLAVSDKYKEYDAKIKYKDILDKVNLNNSKEPAGCRCGEIVRGLISPEACPMFKKVCTSDNPVGPCMVSVEGACNVALRYKNGLLSNTTPV